MTKIIRITEDDIRNIVKESISNIMEKNVLLENKGMDELKLNTIIEESIKKVIGNIRSARLDEMARVGFINGALEVYVWTDDAGKIPHVHVRDTNSNGDEFETCVKLQENDYFLHGHYTDTMNNKQRKEFDAFMRAKPSTPKYNTNYELAVEMWNLNNSDVMVTPPIDSEGNIIIPDYRNM